MHFKAYSLKFCVLREVSRYSFLFDHFSKIISFLITSQSLPFQVQIDLWNYWNYHPYMNKNVKCLRRPTRNYSNQQHQYLVSSKLTFLTQLISKCNAWVTQNQTKPVSSCCAHLLSIPWSGHLLDLYLNSSFLYQCTKHSCTEHLHFKTATSKWPNYNVFCFTTM